MGQAAVYCGASLGNGPCELAILVSELRAPEAFGEQWGLWPSRTSSLCQSQTAPKVGPGALCVAIPSGHAGS